MLAVLHLAFLLPAVGRTEKKERAAKAAKLRTRTACRLNSRAGQLLRHPGYENLTARGLLNMLLTLHAAKVDYILLSSVTVLEVVSLRGSTGKIANTLQNEIKLRDCGFLI